MIQEDEEEENEDFSQIGKGPSDSKSTNLFDDLKMSLAVEDSMIKIER